MEDFPPLATGGGEAARVGVDPSVANGASSSKAATGNSMAWSDLFSLKALKTTGFNLHFDAPTIVDGRKVARCDSEMLEEGLQKWRLALVGHFIGRRPSFHHVQQSLLRQWTLTGNVKITLLESGFFVFRFSLHDDMLKVLEGGFWTVWGRPLILRPWTPSQNLKRISLTSVPIWIRLPNLPFQYWTEEALSAIGSVLGTPLATDAQTKLQDRLSFARLCIEFASEGVFPSSIPIHDEHGLVLEQEVIYEWRPQLCSHCKVFGHSSKTCVAMPNGPVRKIWRPKSGAADGVIPTDSPTRAEVVAPPGGADAGGSQAEAVDPIWSTDAAGIGKNLNFKSNDPIPIRNDFEILQSDLTNEELDSLGGVIGNLPAHGQELHPNPRPADGVDLTPAVPLASVTPYDTVKAPAVLFEDESATAGFQMEKISARDKAHLMERESAIDEVDLDGNVVTFSVKDSTQGGGSVSFLRGSSTHGSGLSYPAKRIADKVSGMGPTQAVMSAHDLRHKYRFLLSKNKDGPVRTDEPLFVDSNQGLSRGGPSLPRSTSVPECRTQPQCSNGSS